MTKPSGLMSLLPPIKDPVEDEEQAKAHAIVMQRINATPVILPAARKEPIENFISFKPSFYEPTPTIKNKEEIKKEKFDRYMDKEYGHEAIKKHVLKEVYQNKKAGRAPYENMSTSSIIVAETIKDKAKASLRKQAAQTDGMMEQIIRTSPTPVKGYVAGATPNGGLAKNKKKFTANNMMVDPKHPDGFRYTDVNDLYKAYGDNPTRYVEEVMYLHEGGAAPTTGVVKPFNNLDSSSFPSNQAQATALSKYGKAYDRLTPMQKKQVDKNKK